jgi:hypothetical protein
MTIFPAVRGAQSDLFSNSWGERLAEMDRHGGGVPPRFLGDEPGIDANSGEPCVQGASYSGVRVAPIEQ